MKKMSLKLRRIGSLHNACFSMLLSGIHPVLSGVAIGAGLRTKVALINLIYFYVIGLPIGAVLGYVLHFQVKNLGELSYFRGLRCFNLLDILCLFPQTKYIKELLAKTKMNQANSMPTPMTSGLKLSSRGGDFFEDATLYQSTVGAQQYLIITRPDISYSVNKVCQFMQNPLQSHWKAVKSILRYLNGTLSYGLCFSADASFSLHGYCDVDWRCDPDDRRSTTDFCWFLGNSPVSWRSYI